MKRVLIQSIPDFHEELSEIFNLWNQAQDELFFLGFRPKRNLEVKLLTSGSIDAYDGINIALEAWRDAGLKENDIAIIFTEKRLFDSGYYQLYFTGSGNVSVISLNFTKIFFDTQANGKFIVFQAILINILTTISHKYGLNSHKDTRICIMDFLNNMPDILENIEIGPQYCDTCVNLIRKSNNNHLLTLAMVLRNIPGIVEKSKNVSNRIFMDKERLHKDESDYDYDVAISFAGEDRAIAEEIAENLKIHGVKVFYDKYEKASLWGKDLYVYLSDVYRLKADYCISLLSNNYANNLWTNHERQAAQERAFKENREYILPVRVDDTKIPGILDTIGYLDFETDGINEIIRCVLEKLADRRSR